METKYKIIWIAVIALLLVGVFFFGWWMKPTVIVDQSNTVDSLRYAHHTDSIYLSSLVRFLKQDVDSLKEVVKKQDKELSSLSSVSKLERDAIKKLPADRQIKLYSENAGDSAYLAVINNDTVGISKMKAILDVNLTYHDNLKLRNEQRLLHSQNVNLRSIVGLQDSIINVEQLRNTKLTDDYWLSQKVINNITIDNNKKDKKIRNRNIVIGVLSGIAAAGIGVAIIK